MNWKKISVKTTEENADIAASVLMDAGAGGVEMQGGSMPRAASDEYALPEAETDTVTVSAYYGEAGADALVETLRARLCDMFPDAPPELSVETVPDTDWNENFRRNFKAFRAAGRFVIRPSWEEYQAEAGDIVLQIDPGMAFGTGDHESTRLCLKLLQKYMQPGSRVLDVGTGSGILGIAAMKLGASSVLALDYDPVSVRVAAENAAANGVVMETRQSDLLNSADGGPYDVILANIVADILIRLNRDVSPYLRQGGVYILGGIIEERLEEVTVSLSQSGMDVVETLAMNDWRAVAARKR